MRHARGGRCHRARSRTGATRLNGQEYAGVRQAEFAFFTPFIDAVSLPTLVAVAMLVMHARKAHSHTLRPAVIALLLLLLCSHSATSAPRRWTTRSQQPDRSKNADD